MTDEATSRTAWGWGLATIHRSGQVLDTWYPEPCLGQPDDSIGSPDALRASATEDPDRQVTITVVRTVIDLDAAPADVMDAYLRLHLLSHRVVRPRTINLEGIFGVLPTVVWTSAGPCLPEGFDALRVTLRNLNRGLTVFGVDKFPRMADYVIPSGVRIADADRVRLGAYLAEGTTVMHEGFVNFNAGTLGRCMVEGRISQGVTVDDGTDIGGGASIMGTLSGGGRQMITVGRDCLLGANSGLGISLGDNCVVEAGLYLTDGTKVTMPDGSVRKARELSGGGNMLFLRDSVTGAVTMRPRDESGSRLNDVLHAN